MPATAAGASPSALSPSRQLKVSSSVRIKACPAAHSKRPTLERIDRPAARKRLDCDQTFTYVTFSPDSRLVSLRTGTGGERGNARTGIRLPRHRIMA